MVVEVEVEAVVARVVSSALGVTVRQVTPLLTWGQTWVAAVDSSGGRLVFKASAGQDVMVEAFVYRRALAMGIPTAAVIAAGADPRVPGASWFVMSHMCGSS